MPQSALLALVPEAEPWVADLRVRYDPVANLGVPAHITLLVPFLPPDTIGDGERSTLGRLFAKARPFDFALTRVGRFPQTVYLEPEPAGPFVGLTEALAEAFPSCPPYGGLFEEVVPHLTVSDKDLEKADAVAAEMRSRLTARGPIRATCRRIQLFVERSGYWKQAQAFRLGA
jgi:2'-5' RNA ligase